MKSLLLICMFGFVAAQAQTKKLAVNALFTPHKIVLFSKPGVTPLPVPGFKPMSLHYDAPKLPFFCSMEDKFRNRFHIFLKLRAGDDDAYEKMIRVGQ